MASTKTPTTPKRVADAVRGRPAPSAASNGTPTEPVTGTGTAAGNINGQAIAITVFSTVKWWGRAWLPAVFFVARASPKAHGTLSRLSFIHFARWNLIHKIPYNGAPQPHEQLHYPHLFFESNFNGGWEEYIDAFAHVIAKQMTFFWGSSYGYPQPLPTGPFKKYIKEGEMEADHFYSAYPDATTTIVLDALQLDTALAAFKARIAGLEPDAFKAEWQTFLTEIQECL